MLDIKQQLLSHFTSEWQQIAIASACIVLVLTIGVTEVAKRLNFSFVDAALPAAEWKRNVMRLAFWLGFGWSIFIMPAIVEGSLYERTLKVIVVAVVNGVSALLGFDTIKFTLKLFKAYVIEWVRAKVRRKLIEEPSQRHEDVNWESTIVKWANGGKGKP